MTEQFACQSYSDDDGILKDCTCGKCGVPDTNYCDSMTPEEREAQSKIEVTYTTSNPPDTEWENEFDAMASELLVGFDSGYSDEIMLSSAPDVSIERLKSFIRNLLTSRDTYWKERVRKEVVGMKVWFMEEDYRDTFPLISKEDVLDNLK